MSYFVRQLILTEEMVFRALQLLTIRMITIGNPYLCETTKTLDLSLGRICLHSDQVWDNTSWLSRHGLASSLLYLG